MKIHTDITTFDQAIKPVVTIGTFDGVHAGHRSILKRVIQLADRIGGESALLTFSPHPRKVIFPEIDLQLITTLEEKTRLLREVGLDHLVIHPFTEEFSRRSAVSYVRDLLVNGLNVHTVVVGYDHHFGRNREGNIESLLDFAELYQFDVVEIPARTIEDVNVSSTKIRRALNDGQVKVANEYLGHLFSLHGEVVEGEKNGRKIGFPTANIAVSDTDKLMPAAGVYAVLAESDGTVYQGMLNIGVRPTLRDGVVDNRVEVHLFDFDRDIYGSELVVRLVDRIRDEQKFDSMEGLRAQLLLDQEAATAILASAD